MSLNLSNNSEIVREFYITYLFYSACGLKTQSNLKGILDNKAIKISVPKETQLTINGQPGICGDKLAKETKNLLRYYLTKVDKFHTHGDFNNIEVKYIVRNEVWNGKLFKDTLKHLCKKFENIGVSEEEVEDMFEYIGENGIRFNF